MFASSNQANGHRALPVDDIESLIYVIYYLLNGLQLPWGKVFMQYEVSLGHEFSP